MVGQIMAEMFRRLEISLMVQAQAVIYGNRMITPRNEDRDDRRFLDGDLFVSTSAIYSSGDGVRGGDFVLPFNVGTPIIISPLPLDPVEPASSPLPR